jgi:pimeloyl-ACP methyl ester carboxylesterase
MSNINWPAARNRSAIAQISRYHPFRSRGGHRPALFRHGFPELAYSWRHQVPAVAANVSRCAPDQRGYGDSSGATGGNRLRPHNLTGDLVGRRCDGNERAGFSPATIGAGSSRMMLRCSIRIVPRGVIGVCTPYMAMFDNSAGAPGERQGRTILYPVVPGARYVEAVMDRRR